MSPATTADGDETTPGSPAPKGEDAANLAMTRTKRLRELLNESLGASSPLAAGLGAANVDLLRMGARLMELTESEVPALGGLSEEFERILRVAQTYLRITRQVERLAQLDVLLAYRAPGERSAQAR